MNIRHNTNGFLGWIKRSWFNFFAKFIQTVSQSHFSFAFECLWSRLSTLWRFPSATTLKYFRNYFERLTDWLGLVIIWYKFYFRKTKLNYQFCVTSHESFNLFVAIDKLVIFIRDCAPVSASFIHFYLR